MRSSLELSRVSRLCCFCCNTHSSALRRHLRQVSRLSCTTTLGSEVEESGRYQMRESKNVFYREEIDSKDFHPQTGKYTGTKGKVFEDKIVVCCQAGDGGDGAVSFLSHCKKRGIPDGGTAANGSSIRLRCDGTVRGFSFKKRLFKAKRGPNGYEKNQTGRKLDDLVIDIPLGTVVTQIASYDGDSALNTLSFDSAHPKDTTRRLEVDNSKVTASSESPLHGVLLQPSGRLERGPRQVLSEMTGSGQQLVVARGGKGGRGNRGLRSRRNGHPLWSERGDFGERTLLELELKCIADVALVGFPNAGKSTLLRAVSNCKPAVSSFAFTTLNPHIGHVSVARFGGDSQRMRWADIPGIVEGAAENRGLGLEFLRHVERTKVLLFVVDILGCDGLFADGRRTAVSDLLALRRELAQFDESMLQRPSVVFANKMDVVQNEAFSEQLPAGDWQSHVDSQITDLRSIVESEGAPVIGGSAADGRLNGLVEAVWGVYRKAQRRTQKSEALLASAMGQWLTQGGILEFPSVFSDTDTDNECESQQCATGTVQHREPQCEWGTVSWFDSGANAKKLTVCQMREKEKARAKLRSTQSGFHCHSRRESNSTTAMPAAMSQSAFLKKLQR